MVAQVVKGAPGGPSSARQGESVGKAASLTLGTKGLALERLHARRPVITVPPEPPGGEELFYRSRSLSNWRSGEDRGTMAGWAAVVVAVVPISG